jgi:hypothetical protein
MCPGWNQINLCHLLVKVLVSLCRSWDGPALRDNLPMQCPDVVQLEDNTAEKGSCGNTTLGPSKQARKKVCVQKKNSNFFPNEDKLLVMSYLEVSNDPVVNTSQKLERLWCRIVKLYNQKRGSYPERTMRLAQSLGCHQVAYWQILWILC